MGMRRLAREFRKNWKFIGAMILLALLAGVGTAFMSNGLNVLFDRASLTQKALPDKPSAEKHYDGLPQTEKENARKAFDSMSEEEKSKYRDLLR